MDVGQTVDPIKAVGIGEKVAFLSDPKVYSPRPTRIICRETHMSWVFIGDEFVYKLKKPVRFSYLDFSTLARREAACRAELRLNRRLAPTVYIDVVPLTRSGSGLALGGDGAPVDWMVMMRRLDEGLMLESALEEGTLGRHKFDRLAAILAAFYAHAGPSLMQPAAFLADWRRKIAENRRVLADSRLAIDCAVRTRIDRALRRFVRESSGLLIERIASRRIVDGHGDLRPEHIWLGEPIAIIDCLEFSRTLRTVDPFDELAFLAIECERQGVVWPARYLTERVAHRLADRVPSPLLAFYRCYRAATRARLAYAHLLEPNPRLLQKWPGQGRAYLDLALREALAIERYLAGRHGSPSLRRGDRSNGG